MKEIQIKSFNIKNQKKTNVENIKQKSNLETLLSQLLTQEQKENVPHKKISCEPGTIQDLAKLQEEVNYELAWQKVHVIGLCDWWWAIYDWMFDELIRQTTIVCQERGIFLAYCRNEFKQEIESYEHMIQSSLAYGERVMDQGVQQKETNIKKHEELIIKIKELKKQIKEQQESLEKQKKLESEQIEEVLHESDQQMVLLQKENEELKQKLFEYLSIDFEAIRLK